jgi:hypothetical protein
MAGGLMQIVAYGAQDVYLTGNPQITFFKVVYRRHTNFACEAIEQTFNGQADFGRRVTTTIARNGDLIHRCYLQATLPSLEATAGCMRWVDHVGHHLIKQVEVEIGGQRIDRQYGDWLQIWYDLTLEPGHRHALGHGYDDMIGQGDADLETSLQCDKTEHDEYTLYVPLQFWFCRNAGLALPLIALQYHEVKINLDFRTYEELIITDAAFGAFVKTPALVSASLWVDYVYLDTEERRRFAQVSHEYLIEQLQFTGEEAVTANTTSYKAKLSFNHPIKELIWVAQDEEHIDDKQWSNYTNINAFNTDNCFDPSTSTVRALNPVTTAKLQLNGQDRFATRAGRYFNLVQPYQHHTNIPESPGINVYSFALKPEEHQPSGSANFSRIDNATLNLGLIASDNGYKVRVYAVNYNVLRIMSGMGGTAYSN